MIEQLTSTDFSPHVNDKFRIHIEGSDSLEAELLDVKDLEGAAKAKEDQRMPFSIIFQCSHDQPLPQAIYKIEHEKIGALELFLVPIGQDEKGVRYEALFS